MTESDGVLASRGVQGEILTVRFESTPDDVRELQRHHVWRGRGRRAFVIPVGGVALGSVAFLALAGMFTLMREPVVAGVLTAFAVIELLVLGMLVGVLGFLTPLLAAQRILSDPQQRQAVIGPRAVSMSEGGLSWRHPIGEGSMSWSGVNRVERDSAAVYIYFTTNNATWVPRRAFASDEEFAKWADEAQAYLAQARMVGASGLTGVASGEQWSSL